jgi:hypothetical protein
MWGRYHAKVRAREAREIRIRGMDMKGRLTKDADIDLGLAVSGATLEPGETRSHEDLAAFCGCSKTNIQHIENRALRKLRNKLQFDPVLKEIVETLYKR